MKWFIAEDELVLAQSIQDYLKQQRMDHGIIIISAKEILDSRIEGLQLGADDYFTKPFHLAELLVRIQALVRRKPFQGQNDNQKKYHFIIT
jgi:DNA-binding response OmpR family regulator